MSHARPIHRATVCAVSIALAVVSSLACDPAPKAADVPKKAAPPDATRTPAPTADDTPAANPPAPAGTVEIGGLYVHTCAEPASCPSMMHAPGVAHCEALGLGSLKWRLPSIQELESWRGDPRLHAFDVFHWSGTAWEDDPGQVWIYDPGSGAKTTAPPTRKPFTIRCVATPG
jgi:hypothetical protein